MNHYKIRVIAFALFVVLLAGCTAIDTNLPILGEGTSEPKEPEIPQETGFVVKNMPATARIVAAGDNLLHNTISFDAESGGTYDFKPVYQFIKPVTAAADIAFVNQEVPMGGAEFGIGKYPMLNAPQEAADALIDAGFNVINEASNHALDVGKKGLLNTLAAWKARGTAVIGAFATQEEAQTPCIIEKNGITMGFVGYSYGTNGIALPADMPWLVSIIDREKIREDIEKLREICEYVVVSLHWGSEYQTAQNDEQKSLAQFVADCGADLIIGHHPHVIQGMQVLNRPDGKTTLCAYSLGNFVASQHKKDTLLGGLLGVTVSRDENGEVTTQNAGILPVMTHFENGGKKYRIIPLQDYSAQQIAKHAVKKYDSPITLEYFNVLAQKVLGEFLATKESFLWPE